MLRLHVIVKGRVQGVGYRAFTVKAAQCRGLCGWVKNRDDGCVELLVEGDNNTIQDLLNELRRGPSFSKVEGLEVEEQKYCGDLVEFVVLR